MRKVIEPQMELGELPIGLIELDPRSRDDIPQILRGLQHLYTTPEVRAEVFAILEELVPERSTDTGTQKVDIENGRPGMPQWSLLVLGVLRLGLNADYDRIRELANEHKTIRLFLGHSGWDDDTSYGLQTLRDNLIRFTPEVLDRINQVVVRAGHRALKKSLEDGLVGRCDSFVVETDVHYPTDTNLLLDAIRKVIGLSAELAAANDRSEWRQHAYHQRQFKRAYRHLTRLRHSTSQDPQRQQARTEAIAQACRGYLEEAEQHLERAAITWAGVAANDSGNFVLLQEIAVFSDHARRQIDQIRRRLLEGERIPHDEKVFSLFEPHTEWISKGKAGVPVELGLRVCVMADPDGFLLHHQVMERCTDDAVAVPMVQETRNRFPQLHAVSMDKGFHSPRNQTELRQIVDTVVLPKKGRCNREEAEWEADPTFATLRRTHAAVESAINALEVHGLDRCRDHGIDGFRRYVGLAVLARNIQHLGAVLRRQERDAEKRRRGPYRKAA